VPLRGAPRAGLWPCGPRPARPRRASRAVSDDLTGSIVMPTSAACSRLSRARLSQPQPSRPGRAPRVAARSAFADPGPRSTVHPREVPAV